MARKQPQQLIRVRKTPTPRPRLASGVIGGILVGLCALWLGWLLLHQLGGPALPPLPVIGFLPTPTPDTQLAALTAEGITLGHTDQAPTVSQQQALQLASQLEPDAASLSKSSSAQYVLLNYPNKSTPATHANFNGVPSWLVVYRKIPLKSAAASVDPTPSSRTTYDVYVFLDANSGKELLVIQV
jgi:hypothetical protein